MGAAAGTSTELNAGPQHRDLFWAPARHQPAPPPSPAPVSVSPASQPHTRWTCWGRAAGALLLLAAPPRLRVVTRGAGTAPLASLQPPGWSLCEARGGGTALPPRPAPIPAGSSSGRGTAGRNGVRKGSEKERTRGKRGSGCAPRQPGTPLVLCWQGDGCALPGTHGCRAPGGCSGLAPGSMPPNFGSALLCLVYSKGIGGAELCTQQWGQAGSGAEPRPPPAVPRAMAGPQGATFWGWGSQSCSAASCEWKEPGGGSSPSSRHQTKPEGCQTLAEPGALHHSSPRSPTPQPPAALS